MLMQNLGVTSKEHYGMLCQFLWSSIGVPAIGHGSQNNRKYRQCLSFSIQLLEFLGVQMGRFPVMENRLYISAFSDLTSASRSHPKKINDSAISVHRYLQKGIKRKGRNLIICTLTFTKLCLALGNFLGQLQGVALCGVRSTSPKQVSSTRHVSCPNARRINVLCRPQSEFSWVLVLQVGSVSAVIRLRGGDFFPPIATLHKKRIILFPLGYFAIKPKCLFYLNVLLYGFY